MIKTVKLISRGDVTQWLERFGAPYPSPELCNLTADRMNKVRTVEQIEEWERHSAQLHSIVSTLPSQSVWNVDKVATAANLLEAHLPIIAKHWENMVETPETKAASAAIRKLDESLAEAISYIELPYGRYEKRTSKTAKAWHIEALLLVRHLRRALTGSGHNDVGETGTYTMAGIVSEALEFVGGWIVEPAAVNAYLTRHGRKYGLPRA